jgi:phage tail tape-measure protein
MKKFIATLMMMAMTAILLPVSASAQTRYNRYNGNRIYTSRDYKKPNIYDKHRNVINIGAGTGIGALIGAIAGGKKGSAIGALIGAGGSALYSYKIKPKNNRY